MNARPFAVTVLAALLAVFTLASSASAECAWVLWLAETEWAQLPNQAPQGAPVWQPEESFEKLGPCNSARAERLSRWKQQMEVRARYTVRVDKENRRAYAEKLKDEDSSQVPQPGTLDDTLRNMRRGVIAEVRCLPDTVDPRGPKASGR